MQVLILVIVTSSLICLAAPLPTNTPIAALVTDTTRPGLSDILHADQTNLLIKRAPMYEPLHHEHSSQALANPHGEGTSSGQHQHSTNLATLVYRPDPSKFKFKVQAYSAQLAALEQPIAQVSTIPERIRLEEVKQKLQMKIKDNHDKDLAVHDPNPRYAWEQTMKYKARLGKQLLQSPLNSQRSNKDLEDYWRNVTLSKYSYWYELDQSKLVATRAENERRKLEEQEKRKLRQELWMKAEAEEKQSRKSNLFSRVIKGAVKRTQKIYKSVLGSTPPPPP